MQQVVAVKHCHPASLAKGVAQPGIPHKVVGVKAAVSIAITRVERKVGTQADIAWQLKLACQSTIDISGVERNKVVVLRTGIAPDE